MRTIRSARAASLLAAIIAVLCTTVLADGPMRATTVILVRHAERGQTPPEDPALTDVGRERAARLSRMLAKAGVTAIITSPAGRAKQTAEPLAKALGIAPETVPIDVDPATKRMTAASLASLAAKVRSHDGGAVVVIGHSNTIPDLVGALGGKAEPIGETDFDDFYVVTIAASGAVTTVRLKY